MNPNSYGNEAYVVNKDFPTGDTIYTNQLLSLSLTLNTLCITIS